TAGAVRARHAGLLRFVLGDDQGRALAAGGTYPAADGLQQMLAEGAVVVNALGGVETQAIEVQLVDPVAGVLDEVFPHRSGALAVEVERVTPFVGVLLRE